MGEMSARRAPAESNDVVAYDVPKYVREFPPRNKVADELRAFMERGIRILAVFTSGMPDEYNHRSQYRNSFDDVNFADRLSVEFLPDSDHIITNLRHQHYVVNQTVQWALGVSATANPAHGPPNSSARANTHDAADNTRVLAS
jgi:hypothetical protein